MPAEHGRVRGCDVRETIVGKPGTWLHVKKGFVRGQPHYIWRENRLVGPNPLKSTSLHVPLLSPSGQTLWKPPSEEEAALYFQEAAARDGVLIRRFTFTRACDGAKGYAGVVPVSLKKILLPTPHWDRIDVLARRKYPNAPLADARNWIIDAYVDAGLQRDLSTGSKAADTAADLPDPPYEAIERDTLG